MHPHKIISLAGYGQHHPHLETSRALHCSSVSKIAASIEAGTFSECSNEISLELDVMHFLMLNKRSEEIFSQFHFTELSGGCFHTCRILPKS